MIIRRIGHFQLQVFFCFLYRFNEFESKKIYSASQTYVIEFIQASSRLLVLKRNDRCNQMEESKEICSCQFEFFFAVFILNEMSEFIKNDWELIRLVCI